MDWGVRISKLAHPGVLTFFFAIINWVWDFRIDHGKRFISSIREGLFLGLFIQTKLHEIFLDALWRN